MIARNNKRKIAWAMLMIFSFQWFYPTTVSALTSGPSQPESQGFQPAGNSDMVDLFTGDFSYNVPLFELPGPNGGYPFNLSYQSGITMEQEASWVGLGFSLNPGAVNRQMRGIPDEFSGDSIITKTSVAPSVTVGLAGGVAVELFGKDSGLKASVGLSVSQNNYKGMSYAIDAGLGYAKAASATPTANLGLNISLDSKEGVGVSPSVGLDTKVGDIGLGVGYNSKSGLSSVSLTVGPSLMASQRYRDHIEKGTDAKKVFSQLSSTTATLNLSHPGYTPRVSMAMRNLSLAATVKVGLGLDGVFPSLYVRGFYNEQHLKDNMKELFFPAYGYMNSQKAVGSNDLLDVNREKDGMVTKEMPNLAIPSHTYDIYSVNGQGIGAMYRPLRNDLGTLHDQEVSSISVDAAAGADVGVPLHVGGNVSFNHSKSTSGKWTDRNPFAPTQQFQETTINNAYEPWQFKVHGESTSENVSPFQKLGGDKAVRVGLEKNSLGDVVNTVNTLENNTWSGAAPLSVNTTARKSRSNSIQTITNGQLLNGSTEVLSLLNVSFLDQNNVVHDYDRSGHAKHHIAGITALTPEGLRYTYGIPAYNLKQEEVSFTAQKDLNATVNKVKVNNPGGTDPKFDYTGTEQFLKVTKMGAYAHSYLLTSIVGTDYVDVTNNGVTADDLGYWVKFTYRKMNSSSNPYKWRDPYSQAHFQEGWKTDPRDDKGSFVYGEKELWYLAQAETRSHIAKFRITQRQDGFGVSSKLQDTPLKGAPVYALSEIDLYARSASANHKIKVVRFEYDNSLCNNVYNFTSATGFPQPTNSGKLTLKKVWFEYGSNNRGKLNPYIFNYSQNPDYNLYSYDRWGTYMQNPGNDPLKNIDAPYSLQDPSQKKTIDDNAAAWSLSDIQLPSGGKIKINYESDDYAYVQQVQAMQMTELVDPYSAATSPQPTFQLKDDDLKVRFRLEQPISGTLTVAQQRSEALKYLDQQRKQLYFRAKINLRSPGEAFYEYISGYVDLDLSPASMGLETVGSNYVFGFFHVKPEGNHHPFSKRAWQHLRTNQPELANSGKKLDPATDNTQRINQIKGLGSVFTQVVQMFSGFDDYCGNKHWGREVVSARSWVRLNSPDKIKYGGGLRVRQITIRDEWKFDDQGVYGQVYDYSTKEGTTTISSGVAAYEPIVGGEENSSHYSKKFTQSVPLRSDNNLFFEYPINESYYPGPQVGYSKVTVSSLASSSLAGKTIFNSKRTSDTTQHVFPNGSNVSFGTTGMTVHEFYTAKDYPVVTDETEKLNKPFKVNVVIPFLGSLTVSNLTTSQGYSIITNDMHGKTKRVSNYRQTKDGTFESEPISWIKYNYRSDNVVTARGRSAAISSSNLFVDNGDGTLGIPTAPQMASSSIPKFTLGQETEFFTDMRQFEDKTWGGGASLNVDGIYIIFGVIPIPTVWPNVSKSTTLLRTAVTNKIIYKSGILESTEAFNEGSSLVTRNVKWDKLTGAVVLTTVNNNFDDPVYSYSIPAYTQYKAMSSAAQNIGLSFSMTSVAPVKYSDNRYQFKTPISSSLLCPGDELLLYSSNDMLSPLARIVYEEQDNGTGVFYSPTVLTATAYTALVVRSGFRNQLGIMAGVITALQDPSIKGPVVTHPKPVITPIINFQ